MAHIKVERRGMGREEWISLRFGWLKRHIYSQKIEIDTLQIREARQVSEMNYEFYDEDYRPLKKGDVYFTPDGTAFIKGDFTLPKELAGKDYCFTLRTAAEMIVKVNGKYVGGIDPNRERINLSDYVKDTKLHIEIEGYNRSKPDDERNRENLSIRGCRQIFEGAYLSVVNREIEALIYDIEILINIAGSELFNEDFRVTVNTHLDKALNYIDFDNVKNEDVRLARQHIQKHIFDNKIYKGSGIVELVAHSHLDIAYYWRKIHSVHKNMRTLLIQLRLMDKYPEFKYAHTQAYTYETLEKYYPQIFEELKEKIATGQFEPVGAMYVEPDCNLPSAESLIRQCLYGQKYFREKFGKTIDNCWLPDVFGNSWVLPQILAKSGVKYFVSNKMSTWNDTNRFPHNNFIWRGIDGSEVYACVPPTHFISWNMPDQIQGNWEAYQDKQSGSNTLQMFGYGDGGSGCTEEMLEMLRRFDKLSIMPETKHVGASEFLHENFTEEKDLATWDGELYLEMHRGTYTTKAELKDYNRKCEFLLRDAEILSILRRKEKVYPAEKIENAYKKLMINQFHDILPGSHITPVYRDAKEDFEEIKKTAKEIIGTGKNHFNTINFKRKSFSFIENENSTDVRKGINGTFVYSNLEGLTGKEISFTQGDTNWFTLEGNSVITPFYEIKFNEDLSIASLYDIELSREFVKGDFNKLKIYHDTPGNYDAWDILPNYKDVEQSVTVLSPFEFLGADGECARFSATLATGKSTWKRIARVFKNSRGIEIENIVNWQESHRLAKVEFDCNILSRELLCDLSAGFIKRETHKNTSWQQAKFETCMHKWCDFSETDAGIAFINENKYGVSGDESQIALSLLRATERPDPTSDLGKHNFCYMIYPHRGDAISAEINNIAFEYNCPLVRADVIYEGEKFEPLFLQSMKLSEDGKKIVYRLSEQRGARGKIKLNKKMYLLNMLEDEIGQTDEINFKPFEIITVGEEI